MKDLGMEIRIDQMGNVIGTRPGTDDVPAVMTGSHIDTVRTGGRYDGNLGVLAGLEIIERLNETGTQTRHPISVAFFSNEEGARFQPDMLGSLVYAGGMPIKDAWQIESPDGATFREELERIGYLGDAPCPGPAPEAFIELHIEQGPVLEAEARDIGVVTGIQGISWTEVCIEGESNHAGTTPMRMRHDAGWVAAEITCFVRNLALEMGGSQVATVGKIDLHPNMINVVASRALVTVDLRNLYEDRLQEAEAALFAHLSAIASAEGVSIVTRTLSRFEPVHFDPAVIDRIESVAQSAGLRFHRMPSGAGHDAQMLARICPAGMIFIPSHKGLSHNPAEHTEPVSLIAGANVLLILMLELAQGARP
jgi:N-carbamoyl-L-amino-acid hydrolase